MLGPVDDGPGLGLMVPPGDEPAQDGTGGGIDGHHLPDTADLGQLDLVGPDQPPPDEVDQVVGQQVLGQEQLTGPALEAAEVEPLAVEEDPSGLEGGHLPDGHEQVPPADVDHQTDHRRVGRLPRPHDEVLHPTEAVTRGGVPPVGA